MAEAAAAVTFLLEQLKEVVVGYADLISGAEKEFELLNDDLDTLNTFLKQTAKKKKKDPLLMKLERRIRDAVYVVDDTIDTCLTKAIESQAKAKKSRMPSMPSVSSKNYKLAKEVKSIREDKVQPLFEDAKKIADMHRIADGSGGVEDPKPILIRDTPIRQNRIVGFEDEEETIIGYLKKETDRLDVIPIIGIPGQGKTTLAWKIYQNDDISYHFAIRIWIYISQSFESRDVFLHILRKFTPNQDTSNLTDDELAYTVGKCLQEQKFLLVLDDVWSIDAWNKIKDVLPLNNGKGKVLITSRHIDVGKKSSEHREPHELKFLNDDDSWKLLQYEVFGNLEECPQELIGIGRHIAIKCGGVPLTIVVIGGILADQLMRSPSMAVSEWEETKVSDALQSEKALQRITDVVAMSYHRLPDSMNECFVYLGIFPEDFEIPAKMLCRLWISEGYIAPKNGRSLEESAEENLNDLICRNLLKVEKYNNMGKVKTCRVHDMIRAFCIAKSKEEGMYQEIKSSKTGALEPHASEVEKAHRLCFSSDLSRFLSENTRGPNVRTFMCFYHPPIVLDPKHKSVIPDNFPMLRILESKSVKFKLFPEKVTKLIHLRYLTLCIDSLKILPEPITELWNLQSLVVETKSRTIMMKANLWKMVRLRYLKTKAAIILDREWKGKTGENLHTLNRLAPESCTTAVSSKAGNLRILGISGKLTIIFETEFLEKLNHLEKLKLVNSLTYEPTSEDKLHGFPRRNCFPPNLKRLTLTNTFLGWQHMSTLAMIKNLEGLKLKDNAFVGLTWKLGRDSFPNLQLFFLVETDLVLWEPTEDSFPKLRFLVIRNCESLIEIPECLGTRLEKLEIERVRSSAVQSAKKIEEASKKGKAEGKFAVQFDLKIGPGCGTN